MSCLVVTGPNATNRLFCGFTRQQCLGRAIIVSSTSHVDARWLVEDRSGLSGPSLGQHDRSFISPSSCQEKPDREWTVRIDISALCNHFHPPSALCCVQMSEKGELANPLSYQPSYWTQDLSNLTEVGYSGLLNQ